MPWKAGHRRARARVGNLPTQDPEGIPSGRGAELVGCVRPAAAAIPAKLAHRADRVAPARQCLTTLGRFIQCVSASVGMTVMRRAPLPLAGRSVPATPARTTVMDRSGSRGLRSALPKRRSKQAPAGDGRGRTVDNRLNCSEIARLFAANPSRGNSGATVSQISPRKRRARDRLARSAGPPCRQPVECCDAANVRAGATAESTTRQAQRLRAADDRQ